MIATPRFLNLVTKKQKRGVTAAPDTTYEKRSLSGYVEIHWKP